MNNKIEIKKSDLSEALSDIDYLSVIFSRLREVSADDIEAFFRESNGDQISLMIYSYLYEQVQNGGFVELIFNGYGPYVFNSPLKDSLLLFGASKTAELITEMTEDAIKIAEYFEEKEKTEEVLANAYLEFPQFEDYDHTFYHHTGVKEIREYVYLNLDEIVVLI